MNNFLNSLIIFLFQRRNTKYSFFFNYLKKIFSKKYKEIYLNKKFTEKASEFYWGRTSGFQHAKDQINKQEKDWKKRYEIFYEIGNKLIYEEPNNKILEIGCSAGQWVKRLNINKSTNYYLGIDVNQESINLANKLFKENININFECMNVYDLCKKEMNNLKMTEFNIVLCCQTLFFLNTDFLMNFFLNLYKGTQVLIYEPVNKNFLENNESTLLNDPEKKTRFGISHNYIDLFMKLNYKITYKKIINGKGDLSSICLHVIKN